MDASMLREKLADQELTDEQFLDEINWLWCGQLGETKLTVKENQVDTFEADKGAVDSGDGMNWIEVLDGPFAPLPGEDDVVLAFSPIDGVGLARLARDSMHRRWIWVHKQVNGATLINGVTHYCKIKLPDLS